MNIKEIVSSKLGKVNAVIIVGIIGFFVSQYCPLWGGIYMLGAPFSQAKLKIALSHTVVFGILGFLISKIMEK